MALPMRRRVPAATLAGRPREFADIYDQMEQLFNAAFGVRAEELPWVPLADVHETEDAYVVEVELPGIRKDQVDIQLDERELVISGEVLEQEGRGLRHRKERRTGRFEFRTYLPGDIDPEGVSANMHDGVLAVRVPKSASEKRRRIEITG